MPGAAAAVHLLDEFADLLVAALQNLAQALVLDRLFIEFDLHARPLDDELLAERTEQLLALLFDRHAAVDDRIDLFGDAVDLAAGNLIDDGVLAVKVVVEIAHAHARVTRDGLHSRGLKASLTETSFGSRQNLLAQRGGRLGA